MSTAIARLNEGQIGKSWSLPLKDGASAKVPCWLGPKHWLHNLPLDLDTARGRQVLKRRHTSVEMVLHIAPVVASFAHTLTGRSMTASHATLAERAGCSTETVRKTLYVLGDLGYAERMATGRPLSAVEIAAAKAHHGGYQPNAASVWHLTVPPTATATPPSKLLTPRRKSASLGRLTKAAHMAATASAGHSHEADRDHLSSRTSVLEESPVGKKSPKRARAHARRGRNPEKSSNDRTPRPLHAQQAAAELIAASIGLDRGHIGAITDVLITVGIDTLRFDGYAIKKRVDQHNKDRGLSWPDRIRRPAAFLRALLTGIDWTEQVPAEPAATVRARRAERRATDERQRAERVATAAQAVDGVETAAYQAWRAEMDLRKPHLAKPASVRPSEGLDAWKPLLPWFVEDHAATTSTDGISGVVADTGLDRLEIELATAAGECLCVFCSVPNSPRRESVPSRSAVCEDCWHSHGFAAVDAPTAHPDTTAETVRAPRRPWTAQRSKGLLTNLISSPERPGRGPGSVSQRPERSAGARRHPHPDCTLCRGDGWVLDLAGEPIEPAVSCLCPSHPAPTRRHVSTADGARV